ncbi:MAG: aspartate/glutamate racemase family protein [Curvibacter sp.]
MRAEPIRTEARKGRLADAPGLIGVLGGMGPLATLDFLHKLLKATPALSDQEHVPVMVSSIPQIPDRTEAFRGKGKSPLLALLDCALRLKLAGVGMIVIPCNTAHLWFDDIQANIDIPILHIVDVAIEAALIIAGKKERIGLLATDATLASGLYINRNTSSSGSLNVQWLLPTAHEMLELVMPGIAAVKAAQFDTGRALLIEAARALGKRGATSIVLGCTEIPIVLNDGNSPVPTVDATAALAQGAVQWSMQQRS